MHYNPLGCGNAVTCTVIEDSYILAGEFAYIHTYIHTYTLFMLKIHSVAVELINIFEKIS